MRNADDKVSKPCSWSATRRYYPRFGFTLASSFGVACEFEVPDEAFMAVELVAGALRGKAGTVFFHQAFHAP